VFASSAHGQRATLSLDGTWQIEESIAPQQQPPPGQHRQMNHEDTKSTKSTKPLS